MIAEIIVQMIKENHEVAFLSLSLIQHFGEDCAAAAAAYRRSRAGQGRAGRSGSAAVRRSSG
ncbi:hypothetical protein ACIPLR_15300 [Herbaspirillum huttiense]|uniref:hypothetical protein n=1 Tax=Herbaspirillum huttiense TaxID=863372 RepID=UPI003800640E